MAKKVTAYKIHNLSRAIETRHLRAAATARRAPMKLLLGGGLVRVVRGRPTTVTESMIRRLHRELIEKEKNGWLKVTLPSGRRVDLNTLEPLEDTPVAAPLPHPPQDSAADDNKYPIGEAQPQYVGGAAATEKLPVPEVVSAGIPEGTSEETVAEETAEETVEEKTEEAVEETTEKVNADIPEKVTEVTEELVKAIYDSGTTKSLKVEALKLELSTEGNKGEISRRLAEAGYKPKE